MKQGITARRLWPYFLFAVICLVAGLAQATCMNPAGVERDLKYNFDCHTYQFCNGTNWVTAGLIVSPSSFNATFGDTNTEATTQTGIRRIPTAQKETLSAPGTIQSLSLYVSTASGNMYLGIYDATGPSGGPGNWLASTASFTATTGWNTASVITPVSLPAGTYWLAFVVSSNTLVVRETSGGPGDAYYSPALGSYSALPNPAFTTTPTNGTTRYSLYATVTSSGCTSPTGNERDIVYNKDYHTSQYCNGVSWVPLGTGSGGSSGNCSNPAGPAGQIIYNIDYHTYQYCNGTNWVKFTGGTTGFIPTTDAQFWTAETATAAKTWQSVAYGNGLFVAMASSTNNVMTSPDGITWTAQTAAETGSVTYGNGLFVAVNGNGDVVTSPDGITWTLHAAALTGSDWASVAYGNGLFVAVAGGANTTNRVATSPDGVTWTGQAGDGTSDWNAVTYGNGLFVAGGFGPNEIMTSPDGITWTVRTGVGHQWWAIAYGNGLFVAVDGNGSGHVMTSPDGITWTDRGAARGEQLVLRHLRQ